MKLFAFFQLANSFCIMALALLCKLLLCGRQLDRRLIEILVLRQPVIYTRYRGLMRTRSKRLRASFGLQIILRTLI